jgi:hypothetical protein
MNGADVFQSVFGAAPIPSSLPTGR